MVAVLTVVAPAVPTVAITADSMFAPLSIRIVWPAEKSATLATCWHSPHTSVNERRLHFGLSAETKASLDISWPNGRKEHVADVASEQLVVVREGSGIIHRESFVRKK